MKTQINQQAYQRAFSQLKISPELRKELLAMTEKTKKNRRPKKFVLRRLAVAAMVMALAFALAMGVNAATGGEIYKATIGKVARFFALQDGGKVAVYQTDDGAFVIVDHLDAGENAGKQSGSYLYKSYEVETDEDGKIVSAKATIPNTAPHITSSAPEE